MKPIKLTMSAFGSYAGEQTIDFTELGADNLYLITGDTGAGKTTIFDAVSFALFGKASGDARSDYTMLRSDFAEDRAKTYVELDFLSGEKRYNIRRAIKNTGQDVALTLPDGTSLGGARTAAAKIEEIVGLDREQFAQIVMIAQNDFLRFLQSGTDDRLRILRRIFRTEALRQFQDRLKVLVKKEADKRAMILHDFERYDVDVYGRGSVFAQWETQIKEDTAGLTEIDGRIKEHDVNRQALAAVLAVAEELGRKFIDLAGFRAALSEHDARAGKIGEIKARALKGEVSLHKLKPLADEAQKRASAHDEARAALHSAKERETATKIELEDAVKALEAMQPVDDARDALSASKEERELAAERLAKATVLRNTRGDITARQNALEKEQAAFESLSAGFIASEETHLALEEAFLRSQAGILAGSLADGEPCPVCGSTDHPAPAKLSGGDVTEAQLKKAREAREKAQSAREQKASECGAISAEIGTLKKRFLTDIAELLPDAVWDDSEAELGALLSRVKSEAAETAARYESNEKKLSQLSAALEAAAARKAKAETASASAQTLAAERTANESAQSAARAAAEEAYDAALLEYGFTGDDDYKASLVTESDLSGMNRQVSEYVNKGEQLARDIARLESETSGMTPPDTKKTEEELKTANTEAKALSERRDEITARLTATAGALKELRAAASDFEKVEKTYAAVKQLADAANGKLDFETFAQTAYFERVIHAANLRLKLMSQNRYSLLRKTVGGDGRRRSGLELEVFDAYTGKARSSNSLSGGESFMASLSLALGLSDIVQQSAGGVRIDAMFIDEGFGSLDPEVLELAVRTLSDMAGANRLIGIISHVAELRERIDKQISVEKTTSGSRIRLVV